MDNPKWLKIIETIQNIENRPAMQEMLQLANSLSGIGNAFQLQAEKCSEAVYKWASVYERISNSQIMNNMSAIVHIPLERNSQSAIAGRLSAPNGKLY